MGLQDNSIDDVHFISLVGNIEPPTVAVTIDQRTAVDGSDAMLDLKKVDPDTGEITFCRRGRPFQLLSRVDTANYPAAIALYDLYASKVASYPMSLVQGGVSCDTRGFKVVVLNVTLLRAVRMMRGTPGISGSTPGGLLECRWNLISVSNG